MVNPNPLSRCNYTMERKRTMKGIVTLYIKMLDELGYHTVQQFKLRITRDDMKAYGIRPEQHKLIYVLRALQYLENEGRKIPLRQKSSMTRAALELYRQQQLAKIELRLSCLPKEDPEIRILQKTRDRIEQSLMIP